VVASAYELVQSCSNLFTLPEIYLRVRDVVDNSESTMDDLANALKLDPAISARLLKIVNSPLYGFPKQIDSIARAVTLLGMQPVSDLVASTTIGQTFTGMTVDLMDLQTFWRKSVRCALLAGKIAKAHGIEENERFFIEGLLRDIGHLVLYQTIPQRAQSALVEAGYLGSPLAEVEHSSIGYDFTEIGAELIRFWGMPKQIEQAIRHQLSPNQAGEFALHASIVHLAGTLADYAELEPAQAGRLPACDPFAVSSTRFNVDECPILLKEANEQLQDTLAFIYPLAMAA
jgi:HD-like signal output (HDOD) protein